MFISELILKDRRLNKSEKINDVFWNPLFAHPVKIPAGVFSFHSISCKRHGAINHARSVHHLLYRGRWQGCQSTSSQGQPDGSFPANSRWLKNSQMFSRGHSPTHSQVCAYKMCLHFEKNQELQRKGKNEKTWKTVALRKQGRENRELLEHIENDLYIVHIPLGNDKSYKTLCYTDLNKFYILKIH